ncbi:MAG: hypothetical protein ACK40X_15145, partial [Armatimonadota bacterium]
TVVRLRLVQLLNPQARIQLSIPLWCDCDAAPLPSLRFTSFPFNPTVVRLRLFDLINMLQ